MEVKAGDTVGGRYEVVRVMNVGGMGAIFEARPLVGLVSSRYERLAIKMLLPRLMADDAAEDFRRRFQLECQMLQKLNHPGIPKFIEFLEDQGRFLLVMEFIAGRNLEEELLETLALGSANFPVVQAMKDATQVLEILDYLHRRQPIVLHRDIKPANMIRDQVAGQIRLVDFGLARFVESSLTQTQVGTLGYTSIEQMQGRADPRSDLYSLAASLHHLLSGQTPKPLSYPDITSLRTDVSPEFGRWLHRALEYNADDRFTSAAAMLEGLRALPNYPGAERISLELPSKDEPLPSGSPPGVPVQATPVVASSRPDSGPASAPKAAVPQSSGSSRTVVLGAMSLLGGLTVAYLVANFIQPALTDPQSDLTLSPTPTSTSAAASQSPQASESPTIPSPSLTSSTPSDILTPSPVPSSSSAPDLDASLSATPSPLASATPTAAPPTPEIPSASPTPSALETGTPQPLKVAKAPASSSTPQESHSSPGGSRTPRHDAVRAVHAPSPVSRPPSPPTQSVTSPDGKHYSLNSPNYPTKAGPAAPTSPSQHSVSSGSSPLPVASRPGGVEPNYRRTPLDALDPQVHLSEEWKQSGNSTGPSERYVTFRKDSDDYGGTLKLTLYTFLTPQARHKVRSSFLAQRPNWSERNELPGIDVGRYKDQYGKQQFDALVWRNSRYYVFHLEGKGSVSKFETELQDCLSGVDFP